MKRDLLSFALWSQDHLEEVFSVASSFARGLSPGAHELEGKGVAIVFEQESLRTRVSFEVGAAQLGAHPVFLQQQTIGIATRESVHDIAQVLSQYVALIVARTGKHQTCVQLADSAAVPVINAMTDLLHPCQILADAFTLRELGRFREDTSVVFLGDGNNIVNSWLELAEKFSLTLTICCPDGYEPHQQILEQTRAAGKSTIRLLPDPEEAVRDADVVYTDVWPHTRGGVDAARHLLLFRPYQVNASLLRLARPQCIVMHRLPANRGEEITGEVLDGPKSVVLPQAANRLHVQKAVMTILSRALTA
jgi:ornithine carbamoyltransferase